MVPTYHLNFCGMCMNTGCMPSKSYKFDAIIFAWSQVIMMRLFVLAKFKNSG